VKDLNGCNLSHNLNIKVYVIYIFMVNVKEKKNNNHVKTRGYYC